MVLALRCPACGASLGPDDRACRHCRSTVGTRRCGVCFEVNLAGDSNCRSCGKLLPVERPEDRKERLACAGCGSPMTPRRLGNNLFDECDSCGGLWVLPATVEGIATEAETRALLKPFDARSGDGSRHVAQRPRYRRCPRCGKHMNRSNYARGSGVIIDICKAHGVFFDRGEIGRIFSFIESGGLEKSRRREAEELRARLSDARRKAIAIGTAGEMAYGPAEDPFDSVTGLDLVRWIASLFAGR